MLNDNLLTTSWLRFSGAEDLGGGLEAIFRLESASGWTLAAPAEPVREVPSSGIASPGLACARTNWGSSTLGRQFHAATDRALRSFDVYNLAGSSVHVVPLGLFGVNRFAGNDSRADNAIKFRTGLPDVLEAGVSVAAGEGATGKSYSADLAHVRKNFELGLAYVHFEAATRVAATGLLPEHEVLSLGGNVALGSVRAYLSYADSALDSTVAGRLRQKNKIVALGLNWKVAPLTALRAAYYDDKGTNLNGIAGRNGKKATLVMSAHHDLSKRTDLYAAAFQNRFTDGYKLDPVNIAALAATPARPRPAAFRRACGTRSDMSAPTDKPTLALQRLYHWERTAPERVAYTQPLGGGQVATYNWRQGDGPVAAHWPPTCGSRACCRAIASRCCPRTRALDDERLRHLAGRRGLGTAVPHAGCRHHPPDP